MGTLPQASADAQALTFRSQDGLSLAYFVYGPTDSPLPPVILQHGFAANHNVNWRAPGVIDRLVSAGRRVVALDARGHGESDKPHESDAYGEAKMATDLVKLLHILDAPTYHLVGYSMGAVIAIFAALRDPRVERLVLGGVGCAVVELGGLDTRALPVARLAAGLREPDIESVTDDEARAFRAFAEHVGADRLALAAHLMRVHQGHIALERLKPETLVIAGDRDPLAARPEILAEAIPHATLCTLPGDHFSVVAEPAFSEALVDFLGSQSAR